MAEKQDKGYYVGRITERSQFERPDGGWQKRDTGNGQFMPVRQTPGPYKDIRKEK